ncbi:MAG: STAS domain-containing protein [Candidatus Zhuqueibacterota bacterium]
MKLLQKFEDDVLIIIPEAEELDIQNSNVFKTELNKYLDQGYLKILVNLKNVSYIDSSGLGSIVSLAKRTLQLHGELKLCELTPDVQSAFFTTQLNRIFDIATTERMGISSFMN